MASGTTAPQSMFARYLLALVCVSLNGCATTGLSEWVADEVTVYGRGIEHDDKSNDAVLLRVKNVAGMEDGSYEIAVPAIDGRSIVLASDGVLEARPLQTLQLATPREGPAFTVTTWLFWGEMGLSDARAPLEPPVSKFPVLAPVSAFIVHDGDMFQVHVVRADPARARWIRVGVLELGPGTQWGGRPLALVVLPVTVAFDIIIFPIGALFVMVASSGD